MSEYDDNDIYSLEEWLDGCLSRAQDELKDAERCLKRLKERYKEKIEQ